MTHIRQTLALVVTLALLLTASVAQANTILVFGQNIGANTVTGTEVAGTTVLTASTPALITALNDGGANLLATFDFFAVSTAPAVNIGGNVWTQTYDGSFSILDGMGFNYLSGVFSGIALGLDGGGQLIFGAAQPPGALTFTSDVAGMPLGFPTSMSLAFTNATNVQVTNGSFGNFTSNVAGNFSAQAVPDGGLTFGLLGFALTGLGYARRRLV